MDISKLWEAVGTSFPEVPLSMDKFVITYICELTNQAHKTNSIVLTDISY